MTKNQDALTAALEQIEQLEAENEGAMMIIATERSEGMKLRREREDLARRVEAVESWKKRVSRADK